MDLIFWLVLVLYWWGIYTLLKKRVTWHVWVLRLATFALAYIAVLVTWFVAGALGMSP